jgi:hypothetical protein
MVEIGGTRSISIDDRGLASLGAALGGEAVG